MQKLSLFPLRRHSASVSSILSICFKKARLEQCHHFAEAVSVPFAKPDCRNLSATGVLEDCVACESQFFCELFGRHDVTCDFFHCFFPFIVLFVWFTGVVDCMVCNVLCFTLAWFFVMSSVKTKFFQKSLQSFLECKVCVMYCKTKQHTTMHRNTRAWHKNGGTI